MQHINKTTECKKKLDYGNLKTEYDLFANRRRQRAYREKDPTKTRNYDANVKRLQRERKLIVNVEETRKYGATKTRNHRARKLSVDAVETRKHEATVKRKQSCYKYICDKELQHHIKCFSRQRG